MQSQKKDHSGQDELRFPVSKRFSVVCQKSTVKKGYANLKFAKKQLYEVYARIKGIFFPALIFISLI
jgi:hypothetical protein